MNTMSLSVARAYSTLKSLLALVGLAASLMEADLLRQKGDLDAALLGYRRVLESFAVIPI